MSGESLPMAPAEVRHCEHHCGADWAVAPHHCPYQWEINDNDNNAYCDCCGECRGECADDV